MAHHDAEVGGGVGVHVVADRYFCHDAQPLRGAHDAAADRRVAHRRAHQRHRFARGFHHGILVVGARHLPVAVAEGDLATRAFERTDGFRRLLARGEDQDFRLDMEAPLGMG
jgi:hypothetical protein